VITLKTMATIAAARFDVTVDQVFGSRRLREHVNARHVTWFMLRAMTRMSYPDIARHFSGERDSETKDHTTVMHGVKRVRNRPDLSMIADECCAEVIRIRAENDAAKVARAAGEAA